MSSPDPMSAAPRSLPATAPEDVTAYALTAAQPGLTTPRRGSNTALVLGIIGVVILAVLALFVVVYLIVGLGPDAFALGGVMALVPLAIVFFGVRWIDRWEPEPRLAVVFAFLWGAAVAVIIAARRGHRRGPAHRSALGRG